MYRKITKTELEAIKADKSFIPLQVGDRLVYQYTSSYVQIVVDPAAMTKTTMNFGAAPMRMSLVLYAGEDDDKPITDKDDIKVPGKLDSPSSLSDDVQNCNTAIGAADGAIDAAIKGLYESYHEWFGYYSSSVYAKAQCKSLAVVIGAMELLKSVIGRLSGVLQAGAIAFLLAEAYSNYSNYKAAYNYWEKTLGPEYSALCCQKASELCDAYLDYGQNLKWQITSNVASIAAMAGLAAGVVLTGGAAAIGIAVTTILGVIADLALNAQAEGYKEEIKYKKKEREYACRGVRGGDDDDPPPTDVINDPSGYVYEAVFSNRVAGATATTYYEGADGNPVEWDAEEYNQLNPLATTPDGFYRWDVPRGNWMVTVEKEGYNTVDSRNIYKKLGTLGADSDGWLPVLPVQTEVHLPMESTEAPQVYEYIAYEDGISLIFSQYMKEETLNITVADKNGTFSGEDLELVWVDQEMSDHYYNRTFASKVMITRADDEYWTAKEDGTVTVSIAEGGKNYAGTDLGSWTQTMKLLPAPAEFTAEAKVSVTYGGERIVAVAVTDRNGKAVAGASVDAEVSGYALVRQAGEETFSAVSYGETDKNGMASFTLSGYCVGEDTLTVSLAGRSEQLEIPVTIARSGVPNEPVVTINGTVYTGQGHEIEVEKGTVITVTGGSEDVLYYNIGRNSCPCQGDQILIGTGSGTITVNESGYYKFAAYDPENELYSSRVHVLITVKSGEAGIAVTAVTPAADGLSISVAGEISNGTGAALTGDLWCAAYNADGRMIGLELLGKQEAAVGGEIPVSGTVALSENWTAGCSVKLLFLHPDTAAPLAKAEAYTAQ